MYREELARTLPNQPMCEPVEENVQTILADIINMAKNCRGLSESIENNLIGSRPTEVNGDLQASVCCLMDAIRTIRYDLGKSIETLSSINRIL